MPVRALLHGMQVDRCLSIFAVWFAAQSELKMTRPPFDFEQVWNGSLEIGEFSKKTLGVYQ